MRKIIALAAVAAIAFAAPAIAETTAVVEAADTNAASASVDLKAGRMLYSSEGRRLSQIYRVLPSGDPQIIMSGRFVTVPRPTVTEAEGKLVTSLTRKQVETTR